MKKLYIISATLFCNNVNADWGQQWGSMIWGQSSTNVPMMGGFSQFIFFVLMLVIGVFVTKRWGLIKTLPVVAVLSLTPIIVDAVQLNTFQNGDVADADDVNENFNNLNQAVQELKEIIKRVSCNAVEGVFLNDSCLNPELDIDFIFQAPVSNNVLLEIDTSSFEFENSNNMEINLFADASSFNLDCQLSNTTNGVISTFFIPSVGGGDDDVVIIQEREVHTLSCSILSANPFQQQPVEITLEVRFY
jgi:hypothetical protein